MEILLPVSQARYSVQPGWHVPWMSLPLESARAGLVPGSTKASLAHGFAEASLVCWSWNLGPWEPACCYGVLGWVWNLGLLGLAWSLFSRERQRQWLLEPMSMGARLIPGSIGIALEPGCTGAILESESMGAGLEPVSVSGPRHWVCRCQFNIKAGLKPEFTGAGMYQRIFFHLKILHDLWVV